MPLFLLLLALSGGLVLVAVGCYPEVRFWYAMRRPEEPANKAYLWQALEAGDPRRAIQVVESRDFSDDQLRSAAFELLGKSKSQEAFDYLLTFIGDSTHDARDRSTAVWMLYAGSKAKHPALVYPVVRGYVEEGIGGSDSSPIGFSTALAILDSQDSLRTTEAVASLYSGCNAEGRERALRILGRTGHQSALPMVMQAVLDNSPRVRECAMTTLGSIPGRASFVALIPCLESSDPLVKRAAHYYLRERSGQELPADRAVWERWFSEQPKTWAPPPRSD